MPKTNWKPRPGGAGYVRHEVVETIEGENCHGHRYLEMQVAGWLMGTQAPRFAFKLPSGRSVLADVINNIRCFYRNTTDKIRGECCDRWMNRAEHYGLLGDHRGTTYALQVDADNEDAMQSDDGSMNLNPNPIIYGYYSSGESAGFRFSTGVSDLSGVTVNTATLSMYAASTDSGGISGSCWMERANSPGVFTTTSNNMLSRTKTTATADASDAVASLASWTTNTWETYTGDGTTSLVDICQEVCDNHDPTALVVVLEWALDGDYGARQITTHNTNNTLAAKLDLDVTPPGGLPVGGAGLGQSLRMGL